MRVRVCWCESVSNVETLNSFCFEITHSHSLNYLPQRNYFHVDPPYSSGVALACLSGHIRKLNNFLFRWKDLSFSGLYGSDAPPHSSLPSCVSVGKQEPNFQTP